MTQEERARPNPHRATVDLSPFEGITVLGESLDVLFSALLRLQLGEVRDGMVEMSATLTTKEGEALERAMTRTERDIPGDSRTVGHRDADRLVAAAERVLEAVEAVRTSESRRAA